MVQASIFVHIHNVYRFVIFFYIFLGLNIQQKSKRIRDLYLYIRYRVYFTLLVPKDLLYVQDFCFSVARVSILSRIIFFIFALSLRILNLNCCFFSKYIHLVIPAYPACYHGVMSGCFGHLFQAGNGTCRFFEPQEEAVEDIVIFPILYGFCSKTACGIPAFKGHYSYK